MRDIGDMRGANSRRFEIGDELLAEIVLPHRTNQHCLDAQPRSGERLIGPLAARMLRDGCA